LGRRRIEFVVLEASYCRDIPALTLDEQTVPQAMMRYPGLTVQMSGFPVETYDCHVQIPTLHDHGVNKTRFSSVRSYQIG
jgi:hypothetical protein